MTTQLELAFGCDVCGAACSVCNRALRSSVEHRRRRCDRCENRHYLDGGELEPEDPDDTQRFLRAWLEQHQVNLFSERLDDDNKNTSEAREAEASTR